MPIVYSDPLHEELLGIIEAAYHGMEDKDAKTKFQKLLSQMRSMPAWKYGQSYSNPRQPAIASISKKN